MADKNTRIFIMKASTAARKAILRNDCRNADYWLRQIKVRTGQSAPKRLKKQLVSASSSRTVVSRCLRELTSFTSHTLTPDHRKQVQATTSG